jgi:hypothetical protein
MRIVRIRPHTLGAGRPARRAARRTARRPVGWLAGLARAGVVAAAVAVWVLWAAGPGLAQPPAPPEPNDLETVIQNLRWWIMGIIATVATLFLVIGGLRYITAGGDPAQVEQAKGNLKSALLGYGLAVLAPVFMTILSSTILGI